MELVLATPALKISIQRFRCGRGQPCGPLSGPTHEQAVHGADLDAQRAAIAAEAQRRGWSIVAVIVPAWRRDPGRAGTAAADRRYRWPPPRRAVQRVPPYGP